MYFEEFDGGSRVSLTPGVVSILTCTKRPRFEPRTREQKNRVARCFAPASLHYRSDNYFCSEIATRTIGEPLLASAATCAAEGSLRMKTARGGCAAGSDGL